jgi:hypothetical protein
MPRAPLSARCSGTGVAVPRRAGGWGVLLTRQDERGGALSSVEEELPAAGYLRLPPGSGGTCLAIAAYNTVRTYPQREDRIVARCWAARRRSLWAAPRADRAAPARKARQAIHPPAACCFASATSLGVM